MTTFIPSRGGFDGTAPSTVGGHLPPPAPQPRVWRGLVDPLTQFRFTNPAFTGPAGSPPASPRADVVSRSLRP